MIVETAAKVPLDIIVASIGGLLAVGGTAIQVEAVYLESTP